MAESRKRKVVEPAKDQISRSIAITVEALKASIGSDAVHLGSDSDMGEPKAFIPSGVPELDLVLDRKGRGWPVGRIVEIYGGEACIPEDTLLFTDFGLLTVNELFAMYGLSTSCNEKKMTRRAAPLLNRYGGVELTDAFFFNGLQDTYKITTDDGASIRSTSNHKYLVLDSAGFLSWMEAETIKVGDYLVSVPNMTTGTLYIDPDVAYFIGMLIADGVLYAGRISISSDNEVTTKLLRSVAVDEIGVRPEEEILEDVFRILSRFDFVGDLSGFYARWDLTPCMEREKSVPKRIRMGNKMAIKAFLHGYIDRVGENDGHIVQVKSMSRTVLNQIRLMLKVFGIKSKLEELGIDGWRLRLSECNTNRYMTRVGTRIKMWVPGFFSVDDNIIPENMLPIIKSLFNSTEKSEDHYECMSSIAVSGAERKIVCLKDALLKVEWNNNLLVNHILDLCKYDFVKVTEVFQWAKEKTYDVRMPMTHSFVAEGLVVHNTCKTGLGYSLIAQAQKAGGSGVLYPCEGNYDAWLAEKYGIDLSKLVLGDDETVEGIFSSWTKVMKAAGRSTVIIGMIDSIAGMTTKAELEEEELKRGRSAQIRAMMISSALRKMGAEIPRTKTLLFCVNQVRENPDVLYGEKKKPPGGMALKFYASVRLKLELLGKVTRTSAGKPYVAGFKIKITAVKNRLAKPYQSALIMLDFENGLLPLKKSKGDE